MSSMGRGSPGLRSPAAGILLAIILAFSISTAAAKSRRQRAGEYYQSGIAQLEKLKAAPERSRSSDDYLKAIRTLGRVHASSPVSGYNDDALLKIGDLYREMSQRYETEPFRTRAIETYKFLIHDYPHSKLAEQARESIREIESARKTDLARKADPAPPSAKPVKSATKPQAAEPVAVSKAVERQRGNGEPDDEDAYQAAIRLLDDFRSVPEAEMGVLQYQLVADAFEEAYDASPAGEHAAEALSEMAGMYRDMAARFGDESHRNRAADAYQKLLAAFPGGDEAAAARKSLESLGKGVEVSANVESTPEREPAPPTQALEVTATPAGAPEIAAKIDAPESVRGERAPASHKAPAANAALINATLEAAPVEPTGEPVTVLNVRHWSHSQYTRVAIELDARVPFKHDRVPNPERIFFDLGSSLLSAELAAHSTVTVDDKFVKAIRIAQNKESVVRVVFDLKSHAFFGASWLTNPTRLLIELRSTEEPVSFAKSEEELLADRPVQWARNNLGTAVRAEQPDLVASPLPTTNASVAGKPAIDANDAYRMIEAGLQRATDLARQTLRAIDPPAAAGTTPAGPAASKSASPAPKEAAKTPAATDLKSGINTKPADVQPPVKDDKAAAPESRQAVAERKSPPLEPKATGSAQADAKTAAEKATPAPDPITLAKLEGEIAPPPFEQLAPPKAADATSRGNRNLVRALGLKVGRVVIDAGHGGHDVGTIGPSGLYEKDVALDVAVRLGKLIEERLGAEVVYTRTDDRYIKFSDRTKLANDNGADLFLSIHANSARSRGVRGVETYYLNLKGDPWAMAVASRENAASDHSIHELQGLVSKITLNEKIEESREFATRIQKELFEGLSADAKSLRDRGVRKAPFLVLLGAKMPAVLAEIAFISNPTDEKLLKTTKFRQEVAEHLFKGISGYADSLGNTSVARKQNPEGM